MHFNMACGDSLYRGCQNVKVVRVTSKAEKCSGESLWLLPGLLGSLIEKALYLWIYEKPLIHAIRDRHAMLSHDRSSRFNDRNRFWRKSVHGFFSR